MARLTNAQLQELVASKEAEIAKLNRKVDRLAAKAATKPVAEAPVSKSAPKAAPKNRSRKGGGSFQTIKVGDTKFRVLVGGFYNRQEAQRAFVDAGYSASGLWFCNKNTKRAKAAGGPCWSAHK